MKKQCILQSLAFLLLLNLLGCSPKERASQDKAPAAVGRSEPADPAQVIQLLEAAGAEFQRNTSGNVSQVSFRGPTVADESLDAINSLQQLQGLTISGSELTDKNCEKIGTLQRLRHLDLRESKIGNSQFLLAVGPLTELQSLRLSGKNGATTVDDDGIIGVKKCLHLKVLAADFCWIGEKGLAELKSLGELRELYLANSLVDDSATAHISAMSSLKKLRLSKTGVTREGLDKLTALRLEDLDISECVSVEDAALEPVGRMTSLKKLNLWRDVVGDAGAKHIASLVNLEWLNVDNTQMSDASLPFFKGFSKLKFLHLGSTQVTDAGMVHLLGLSNLADLKVTRTSVTEEGVAALRKAIPKLDIQLKYGKEE